MLYQPSSERVIFKRIKPSIVLAVKLRVFIHLTIKFINNYKFKYTKFLFKICYY